MRPVLIVIDPPCFDLLSGIIERDEHRGLEQQQAAQPYIPLHDEVLKEAAERLSAIKPAVAPSPTVTTTGIKNDNGVDSEAQTVETRPALA